MKIIKKILAIFVVCSIATGCSGNTPSSDKNNASSTVATTSELGVSTSTPAPSPTPTQKVEKPFTNKYGTATTVCVKSGCSEYIAPSGDTNCCVTHSNTCKECYKYIDGDALYCMSCISSSVSKSTSSSSSSSSYGSSSKSSYSSSGTCKFKQGGEYVCNSKATDGSFCSYHKSYLDDAYSSIFGD